MNFNWRFPLNKGLYGFFESNTTLEDYAQENIKNVLFTRKRERVVLCDYGTNIYNFLFEQKTPELKLKMQSEVIDAITRWVPNVKVQKVFVIFKEDLVPGNPFFNQMQLDDHSVLVTIIYSVVNKDNTIIIPNSISLVLNQ